MVNNTAANEVRPASNSSSANDKSKNTIIVFIPICLTDEEKEMRYNELNEYDESLRNLKGYDLLIAHLTYDEIVKLDLSEVHPQIAIKLIDKYHDVFKQFAE